MKLTYHMLYWTEFNHPQSVMFQDLDGMLRASEALRKRQLAGEDVSFVCSSTQDVDSTGQGGSAVAENYQWYKRRADPTIPLGRNLKRLNARLQWQDVKRFQPLPPEQRLGQPKGD